MPTRARRPQNAPVKKQIVVGDGMAFVFCLLLTVTLFALAGAVTAALYHLVGRVEHWLLGSTVP